MDEGERLAERFEQDRAHLRAVAYRMLGSASEADDAVQETWLHASRADLTGVRNLSGWLTTVVGRVCLDMLRARRTRREEPLDAYAWAEAGNGPGGIDPEHEAILADSVGIALLVVLEKLAPAERIAFVLHDMFAVPFEQIATVIGRSPAAARQLASRARRRVRRADAEVADPGHQRGIVEAFLAASRDGDFDALLRLLDPDVVVRADARAVPAGVQVELRGAPGVAEQALTFSRRARHARIALVNGAPGIVVAPNGRLATVLAFRIRRARIVELDVIAEPARLRRLDLAVI